MNDYELDHLLEEYLKTVLTNINYSYVVSTFNKVNFLNTIPGLPVIDLDNIENALNNIISENEESASYNIGMVILNSFSNLFKVELYKYGITIDVDFTTGHKLVYQCFNTIYTVYDLEYELLEEIKFLINDTDLDYSETFAKLVSLYNNVSETELIENILDVNVDFFDSIKEYITKKEINLIKGSDMTVLEQLATLDSKYRRTGIYNTLYKEGYSEAPINSYIDEMYGFIDSYNSDITRIAYEVAATLFIASDTRYKLMDALDVNFNIDAIKLVASNNLNISDTIDSITELINKLLTELEERI